MTRWCWVSLDYATFGIAVRDGKVVDAAPIARWSIGTDWRTVAGYFPRKGARFAEATPPALELGKVEDARHVPVVHEPDGE